ncbi:hypothetical protein [Xylanibacter muris]|uniref:hypothetical protein n=1 Tax=Xylanibacter muris TaxID=2736290 RepID=UPI0025A26347|nr:hypothetical protein [Xylanibacter muris]
MKRTYRASYSVEGQADGLCPFLFFISVTMTSARMKIETKFSIGDSVWVFAVNKLYLPDEQPPTLFDEFNKKAI